MIAMKAFAAVCALSMLTPLPAQERDYPVKPVPFTAVPGMADVGALTGDMAYVNALDKIWENVAGKKLHIMRKRRPAAPIVAVCTVFAGSGTIAIDTGKTGARIPASLYGIFFAEIWSI
jgi:hypothetical protein